MFLRNFVTLLTESRQSTDTAMSLAVFAVYNNTSTSYVGGTLANMQTFDDFFGFFPGWSLSFTKHLTGLTVGNTYSLKVQAAFDVSVTSGFSPTLDVSASTFPITHHLTLSVIQ